MLSKHWLAGLALCAATLPSTGHAAVTEDTFQLRTHERSGGALFRRARRTR